MVALYSAQSSKHCLDTRHTYTLAQQAVDLMRLRVTAENAATLPTEWLERALCSVCGSGEDWEDDPIMFCDGCYTPSHFLCLGFKVGSYAQHLQKTATARKRRLDRAGGERGLSLAARLGQEREPKKADVNSGQQQQQQTRSSSSRKGAAASSSGSPQQLQHQQAAASGGGEEEEQWLCPACESLRRQVALLDDDSALKAIRVVAGPRTAAALESTRQSLRPDWKSEKADRFDVQPLPRLLGMAPPAVRRLPLKHLRLTKVTPTKEEAAQDGADDDEEEDAETAAAGENGARSSQVSEDSETRPAVSSEEDSQKELLHGRAFLRRVPLAFSDAEPDEWAAGEAPVSASSVFNSASTHAPQSAGASSAPSVQTTKSGNAFQAFDSEAGSSASGVSLNAFSFFSKDCSRRFIVEAEAERGLSVVLRIPCCIHCGLDAFCAGGGPVRRIEGVSLFLTLRRTTAWRPGCHWDCGIGCLFCSRWSGRTFAAPWLWAVS